MAKRRKVNPYPGSRVCLTSSDGEMTTYKPNAWWEGEKAKIIIDKRHQRKLEKQRMKEGLTNWQNWL